MNELKSEKLHDILENYKEILETLQSHNYIRTKNLVGDLGETLFSKAFNWNLEKNSCQGYDAISADGTKYQIKTRRGNSKTIRLSAIRDLKSPEFDYLAILIFKDDFTIRYAGIVPSANVAALCTHQNHTNSDIPLININHLKKDDFSQEVTEILQNTLNQL